MRAWRIRLPILVVVVVMATSISLITCSDADDDCSPGEPGCKCTSDSLCDSGFECVDNVCVGEGGGGTPLDWFTSSCGDLGGEETSAGACYIACSDDNDCGHGTECCNESYQPYCRVGRGCGGSCNSDSDCGPAGWRCRYGACYLGCEGGAGAGQCPINYGCRASETDSSVFMCEFNRSSSGSCGEPCPDGCCSSTGLTCAHPRVVARASRVLGDSEKSAVSG